ncbi:EF-hand domain-containing protein [Piscinibacter sp. XHJ-5]|uniref:EF-hand domain-containing protein n=1 Tax=Piscinibacter sp. XHJ-5 TaxID=3037797 RepID=UPI0024537260|nr:EF-hand domain-containing protein [Piscinibacter sp. XHJ-5]
MNRLSLCLLATSALTLSLHGAYANEAYPDGVSRQEQAARVEHLKAQIDKRFSAADVNHDGKLSRDEARTVPRISRRFDEIDTGKTGYITKEQVQAKLLDGAK